MSARPQTAIGAALQRAGLNTCEARLRQAAADALRKHHRNIARALPSFETTVEDDPELVREALLFYLCHVGNEMSGDGHETSVPHSAIAETRQPNGDASGHSESATLTSRAAASPTNRGGMDQASAAIHTRRVHPVREPSMEHRAAAGRIAQALAITIFDTFKVRDGRAIGDVRFGELRRMMSANAIEAAVIRQILEHGAAPHDARVRDVVKIAVLQKMIQRAAEMTDGK